MSDQSTQTVFALRKEGQLNDALAMARAIYEQTPGDLWAVKALGYCLYDAIKAENSSGNTDAVITLVKEFSSLEIDEYEDDVLWGCQQRATDMADPSSGVRQKAKELSKDGNHAASAQLLRNARKQYPENKALQESLGWELYRLVKTEDTIARGAQLLREYATLKQIHHADLLHSLMLSISLQWAETWDKFIEYVKWWNPENLRYEDHRREWNKDHSDQYPSLAEKTATALYKHIKKFKVRSPKVGWVLDYVAEINEKSDDEWMPYRLAKLSAWLGGDLASVRKKLIPLARLKSNEFWMWEALAEVSEDRENKMACFAKALMCKAQNESYKVELYHLFAMFLLEQNEHTAASAVAGKYCDIQSREKRKLADDIQAFLESGQYSDDSSFDLKAYSIDKSSSADELLSQDLPWLKGNFITLNESKDGRPPILRVILDGNKAIGLKVGNFSDFSFHKGDPIEIKMSEGIPDSNLSRLHGIRSRQGDANDCVPHYAAIVSRLNAEKGLSCVSLNARDVVLLHYDRDPEAKVLKPGDRISIQLEHNTKNNRYYPIGWKKTTRSEIEGFFVKFSGNIDIQNGNPFGFVRGRGVDIFVSPPQVKSLNLDDGDSVSGWAIRGENKKKRELSWSALILNKA